MLRKNKGMENKLKRLNRIGERASAVSQYQPAPPVHNVTAEKILEEILIKEENMQKLILDQPSRVTNEGTVETIVSTDISLNEIESINKKNKEVLINEDPMDGIQIILND